jgi:hypothetical protein
MARARSLGAELRFPRVAARWWRRWLSRLSLSHEPPSPPRRRVYPSFPPLCVAFEKLSFADLQRNDSECANISMLLSLGATARPTGYVRRCCACLCRNGPLERRRRRYRVIGTGKAPDPVAPTRRRCREGAEQRCAGPRLSSARVRMIAIGQPPRSCTCQGAAAQPQQADNRATAPIFR